ncbi:MAG TPA: signal peptide peptidase SppA [Tepidisphaeraceae bacterium]|jgi:protease-4
MFKSCVLILFLTATVFAAPATQPSLFPTPAELAAKIRAMHDDSTPKVAYISLPRQVMEKQPDFELFPDVQSATMQDVIARIQKARDDDKVKAILLNVGETSLGLAQAEEIRDALADCFKHGKRTFVYADAYDTTSYILATGASDICLLSGGEMMLPGVGLEPIFIKGLLDKIGVQADYVQIGQYKGADEEFTRTQPSPEFAGELNKLADSMYQEMVDSISTRRKLPPDQVQHIIDQSLLEASDAKSDKLVDHLVDEDGLRDLISKELGKKIELVHHYGEEDREGFDPDNPWSFFAMIMKRPAATTGPTVAIVHADGVIVDGDAQQSLFGDQTVGSDDIRRAMRMVERDDNIKAVVLRINSPGGSALASEAMWQAVHRAAVKKPIIVSVGSMAASGGYYLASAANTIYADPTAIVGSIGVVGGKFVITGLFDKVGLSADPIVRGKNADLFDPFAPFSPAQREMVTAWMTRTYQQFTQRVLSTRKNIKDIDKVARGRVFLARQAKQLGMVDEIGGLDAAIDAAASRAGLKTGEYQVETIPGPRTFADILMGDREEASSPIRSMDLHLLGLIPQSLRTPILRELTLMQISERQPVMLITPFTFAN